ncbi:hypothetical protein [Streptomyces zaomyceticus]|uniref:hypothetical protein n=1 Tax=Streptomyces zaomyceticus TaxID=68286 RepID=UPI002E15757F|nr:hypothetical protein OG237_37535 [Streptomyces zaomyceticus]
MSENALPEPDDVTKDPGAVDDGDGDGDDGGCDDGYRDGDREGVADGRAESGVGCLLAVAGVAVAGIYALPRAEFSIEGGFEGHARDWSVILVDVPLILLAGLLVPPMTWAAATRWLRPWVAFLVCVAVAVLGLWGVSAVWHPRQTPDPGYGPGI